MMDVGMMLRNKATGDEVLIVKMFNLSQAEIYNNIHHTPKLSPIVYVLENEEGERHHWNATHMHAWEIVKQKILFKEDVECIACKENTFHERFERCLSCGSGMNLWSE
jgi:hypothetical protein